MCGIFGFINADHITKFGDQARLMFEQGLWHSTQRGIDGTGVLVINGVPGNYEATMYKSASYAPEFLSSNTYRRMLQHKLDYGRVAIGHTRATTKGSVNQDNAHPFIHKHITLVHNGYIRDSNKHLPAGMVHDVDSFSAAYLIAEKGAKEALEALQYGGVFVWWNATDGTLNMARNEHRTLYCVGIRGQNALFYASEWQMLHWILARNGVEPETTYNLLTPHTIFTWDPTKPKEWTKTPFAKPQSQNSNSTGQTGGSNQRAGTTSSQRQGGSGLNAEDRPTQTGTGEYNVSGDDDSEGSKRPDQYTEAEMAHFERFVAHLDKKKKHKYGIPDSRHKLRKVCAKIANTGIRGASFGNRFIVYPDAWAPYKNQRDCGVILGSKRDNAHIKVEIPNTCSADFNKLKADKWGFAMVVNAKKRAGGGWTLVMALVPEPVVVDGAKKHLKADGTEATTVKGPGGRYISVDEFLERTKSGCGNCTGFVNPNKPVVWYGDEPICNVCHEDPQVCSALGIDQDKAKVN